MDEVIKLMEQLLDGKIDCETFAGEHIILWRDFRDEAELAIKAAGLREKQIRITRDRIARLMSSEQFVEEQKKLYNLVPKLRLDPLSREAEIISHIMVESDAYESNPKLRSAHMIGEAELIEEVSKALIELKNIQSGL